jgi:hypothetical protein
MESLTVFLRVSDIKGWAANPVEFAAATAKGLAGGEVDLSYHNLAGKGRKLTGSFEWDWQWDMEKKGTLSLRVPYFLGVPFWCDLYLFDWKETWHTGLFREDDVTLLEYGGGLAWFHMFSLWLEGRLGVEYYQRTFNRTFADGDIFSGWTRWAVTTARLKNTYQLNAGLELFLDYNAYHPMSTFDFTHYGRSEAIGWLKKGLGHKLTATGRLIGGWSTHNIPLDRQFRFGTERVMRGHAEYRRLGTIEACATAELAWQVMRGIKLIPFIDTGSLWYHGRDMDFDDVEKDAGLGIEATWPVLGRCRFDYAHGIDGPASTNWNVHFTYDRDVVR